MAYTPEQMFLLVMIVFVSPILMVLIFAILDFASSKKARILYFESEKQCRMMNKKIKDGMFNIKDKTFYVDKATPPMIPAGSLFKTLRPFYAIKHDKAIPLVFTTKGLSTISASNLKKLIENKTLAQLLQPQGRDKFAIIMLIIGGVMGGLIGYLLSASM